MDLVPDTYRNENEILDCPCRTDHNSFMIQCDNCDVWYHGICINLTEEEAWLIDQFYCHECRDFNPTFGITLKRLCWTPSCNKVARKNSHYCHKECGLQLVIPSIRTMPAEEIRRPSNLPKFIKSLRKRLEIQDAKIIQLLLIVQRSKNSPADTVCFKKEQESVLSCKMCLEDCSLNNYHAHLRDCFRQRKIVPTGGKTIPEDIEWNIFCNRRRSGDNRVCKELRVLCAEHYRGNKEDDMICGFPLEMDLGATVGTFCGFSKADCKQHPFYWEELRRAEFDLDKLQILLNLSELEKEAADGRKASLKRKRAESESEQQNNED